MVDELIARRVANTAEYQAFKNTNVDVWLGVVGTNPPGSVLTGALDTGGSGTTFTVADATGFPSGAHQVIIDQELIDVSSRSGNVSTISARGKFPPGFIWSTTNVAHSAGASVWYYPHNVNATWGSDYIPAVAGLGLANLIGMGSYARVARMALAVSMMYGRTIFSYDQARFDWPYILRGYDWLYNELTDHEKSQFALAIEWQIQNHLDGAYELNTLNTTQRNMETQLTNNIPSGSLRLVMVGAAVSYGYNPSAQTQWNAGLAKFTNWVIPALLSGPFSGGNSQEGAEYTDAIWQQVVDQLEIIRTATGVDYWPTVTSWYTNFAHFLFHQSTPGSSNSPTTMSATVSSGSTAVTVNAIGDFEVGHQLLLGGVQNTEIVAISGLTVTIAQPAEANYTNATSYHVTGMLGYSDVQDAENLNHRHTHYRQQHNTGLWKFFNCLRRVNATLAAQVKFHLDHFTPLPGGNFDLCYHRFMEYDPTVVGVDYRTTLPLDYFVTGDEATGLMISRTSWDAASAWVIFHGGNRGADHIHSDYNMYKIVYKGAFIAPELTGYQGLAGGESAWVGAKYHNGAVMMEGHGGASGTIGVYSPTTNRPDNAKCPRGVAGTGYAYIQGDASKAFQGTFTGSAGTADTFVRDFFFIKPALTCVWHDRLVYLASSTSPTQWNHQYPANPSVVGQIATCVYGGQTRSHEIIRPASATLTEIAQSSEYPFLDGYRIETVSGVSASTEYGLGVEQFGTGITPAVNTLLTTTNANVVQIGSGYVVGFVKGATPTLNITYTVSGTPRNLLAGFVPNVAYHVVRSVNTITISVATLSGDTSANSGGILDFTI